MLIKIDQGWAMIREVQIRLDFCCDCDQAIIMWMAAFFCIYLSVLVFNLLFFQWEITDYFSTESDITFPLQTMIKPIRQFHKAVLSENETNLDHLHKSYNY